MLKYVRLHSRFDGDAFLFTLPPVSHATLAKAHEAQGYKPVSAGFVNFGPGGVVTTHGRSESLNLGPLPDDAARIAMLYDIVGVQVHEDAARHVPTQV
ncbi:MAG TPA: hypothetical protein VL357_05915 [Rariglobus sp.]|jgi:hypothetical protein|nr:hypothetical protein [Rariglobus sp.]